MSNNFTTQFVFCFIFFICCRCEFLIPFNNTQRFKKIFVPSAINSFKLYQHEIHNQDIFFAPTRRIDILKDVKELCSEAKTEIFNFPDWKNGSTNCEKYFCNGTSIIIEKLKNENITSSERQKFENIHIMVHRYCVQCADSIEENFHNTSCEWFKKDYCSDYCSSTCIYYKGPTLNLCYQKDNGLLIQF
jgi:hypothetical protein